MVKAPSKSKTASKAKTTSKSKTTKGSISKKDTKKKVSTSKTASTKTKTAAVKEKASTKKYDLPGQKKDTPEELDAVRMFYESSYKENPNSEMAARWCLTYGLLPYSVANNLHTKGFDSLRKKNAVSTKITNKSSNSVTTKRAPASAATTEPAEKPKPVKKLKAAKKSLDSDSD